MVRTCVILACLAATVVAASCGGDDRRRRGRRSRMIANAEAPAGIQELSSLLAEFRDNLADGDFDAAAELVPEMEAKVKRADLATIAHSDYAEISAAIERARDDVSVARTRHAINEIIKTTEAKLAKAGELNAELIEDGPNEDDLDDLDDLLEDLTELGERGVAYRDDSAFAAFAQKRDARIATFTKTAREYRWLLNAKRRLGDALDGADREIDEDAETEERIDHADDMLAIFEKCVEATRDLALAQGFVANMAIDTPIGAMNLQKTQEVCEKQRVKHEAMGHGLRWKKQLIEVGAAVDAALERIEAQKSVADQLEANRDAVETLGNCAESLAKLDEHPGYDPAFTITTHMGKFSSTRLRNSCTKVRNNLVALQPTLEWRIALTGLEADEKELEASIAQAAQEEDGSDRQSACDHILGKLRECVRAATRLVTLAGHQGARPHKNEVRAAQNLVNRCNQRIAQVAKIAGKKVPEVGKKPAERNPPVDKKRKKKRKKRKKKR